MRDRPGVIVYVTRAAPFEWELLLFDVVGEPGYEAIVPGGGIEQGETPEDAGVREVLGGAPPVAVVPAGERTVVEGAAELVLASLFGRGGRVGGCRG